MDDKNEVDKGSTYPPFSTANLYGSLRELKVRMDTAERILARMDEVLEKLVPVLDDYEERKADARENKKRIKGAIFAAIAALGVSMWGHAIEVVRWLQAKP